MRFGCFTACYFAAFFCACGAPAEDARETLKLDFKSVRLVKLSPDAEEPTVEISVTSTNIVPEKKFKTELRTRTIPVVELQEFTRTRLVPVTTMREEKRTRRVTIDGKQVDQTYTVKIPVTGQKAQTDTITKPLVVNLQESYEVRVPISPDDQEEGEQAVDRNIDAEQPSTIKLADISAWDVKGDKIDADDLARRLSRRTGAFLLERPISKGVQIERAHLAVLREDTLFLYLRPRGQDPLAENSTAP